jgi:DNA anti-recombination protein RmuC
LLSTIGERAGDFVAAADQLRELRVGVQSVLAETGERVRDMQAAADSFRSVATEASAMTRTLRDAQASQLMTAEITGGIVKSTGEVVERQAAVVRLSQETYGEAARVLDGIDEQLASALQTISTRMQDYNRQVEKNFETIIKTVNARMPELFERLEGLLQQVTEAVEELNDTLRRRS